MEVDDQYGKQYGQWLLDEAYYINTELRQRNLQAFARHRLLLTILVHASKAPLEAIEDYTFDDGTTVPYGINNAFIDFVASNFFFEPLFLDWLILDNDTLRPTKKNLDVRMVRSDPPWQVIDARPFLMTGSLGGKNSRHTKTLGWLVTVKQPSKKESQQLYSYFDVRIDEERQYELFVTVSAEKPQGFQAMLEDIHTRTPPPATLLPVTGISKGLWLRLWPDDGPKVGNFLFAPTAPMREHSKGFEKYYGMKGVFGVSDVYGDIDGDVSKLRVLYEPTQEESQLVVQNADGEWILNGVYETVSEVFGATNFQQRITQPPMRYNPLDAQSQDATNLNANTPIEGPGIESYVRDGTPFAKWLLRHMRYAGTLANHKVLQMFVFHRMLLTVFASMINNGAYEAVEYDKYVSKVQYDPVFLQDFYFDYVTDNPLEEPTTQILQNNASRHHLSELRVGGILVDKNTFGRIVYYENLSVGGQESVLTYYELSFDVVKIGAAERVVVASNRILLGKDDQVRDLDKAIYISIVPYYGEYTQPGAKFLFQNNASTMSKIFAETNKLRLVNLSVEFLAKGHNATILVQNLYDILETLLQLYVYSKRVFDLTKTYKLRSFVKDDLLIRLINAIPPLPVLGVRLGDEETLRRDIDLLNNQMEGIIDEVSSDSQNLANETGEQVTLDFGSDQERQATRLLAIHAQVADNEAKYEASNNQSNSLQEQLLKAREELQQYRNRIEKLESELVKANDELEDATAAQEHYFGLISQYQTLDQEKKNVETQKEELNQERLAMHEHEGELQQQYRIAFERLKAAELSIQEKDMQQAELKSTIANNASYIEQLKSDVGNIRVTLDENYGIIAQKQDEINNLKAQLLQKDQEILSLKTSLDDANAALQTQAQHYETQLQATMAANTTTMLDLQKENARLERELDASHASFRSIETRLGQLKASYDSELEKLQLQNNELLERAKMAKDLEQQLLAAQTNQSRLEAELAQARQELESAQRFKLQNDKLFEKYQEADIKAKNLENELITNKKRVASLEKRLTDNSLPDINAELQRLREEKKVLDARLIREREAATQQLGRVEEARIKAEQKLSSVTSELAVVKSELQNAKRQLEQNTKQNQEILNKSIQDYLAVKAERDALRRQLAERKQTPESNAMLAERDLQLATIGVSIVNGLKLQILQNKTNFLLTRPIRYRSRQEGASASTKEGYKWLTPALLYSQGMSKPYADNLLRAVQ